MITGLVDHLWQSLLLLWGRVGVFRAGARQRRRRPPVAVANRGTQAAAAVLAAVRARRMAGISVGAFRRSNASVAARLLSGCWAVRRARAHFSADRPFFAALGAALAGAGRRLRLVDRPALAPCEECERAEQARLRERDPDDVTRRRSVSGRPRCSAPACSYSVSTPLLAGAVADHQWRRELLIENSNALRDAPVIWRNRHPAWASAIA